MKENIKIILPYGEKEVEVYLPKDNVEWIKSPNNVPGLEDEEKAILEAIRNPIGIPALDELVKQKGKNVVLLVDDMTRAAPQNKILPILLNELNRAGVEDKDISAIIALGTHRPMTQEEILKKYGEEAVRRIKFVNHDCRDKNTLVKIKNSNSGLPVYVNKTYYESDISIAVGNIIPHMYAGWAGGAKMIQPGVCGIETTGETHFMASEAVHDILGKVDNPVRREIENAARITGLTMIVNTILNKEHEIVKVVAGDFIQAHREALSAGQQVYSLEINDYVDIMVASANPAYLDFWQSIKAFNNCAMAVRPGGTLILLCADPEGIAPDHPELVQLGTCSREEAKQAYEEGFIKDKVGLATYLAMTINRERVETYLISEGIPESEAEKIGLKTAPDVGTALKKALQRQGSAAKIGVVTHGADIYFRVKNQ
ncbi:MAG: nickel-dependent lactate racemase [Clostridia bacterium]